MKLNWKSLLPAVASVAIIAIAATVLWRTLAGLDAAEVAASFAAIPASGFAGAALFTALAYLSLAAYEVAMLRYLGAPVGTALPLVTGLMAYPIGHAVGFGALSGGAVRFRVYSAAGLSTFDVGKIVVLSALPYAGGLGLLAGASLVLDPAAAGPYLRLASGTALAIGAALLAAHALYVLAVFRAPRPLELRRLQLELPSPRLTGVQYGLGIVDVLCGVAVLYVLLPESAAIGFLPFVAVYVAAILAGLASSVPAGLGVFESALLLMLEGVPPGELLGAVLAYRLVYELVPFAAGVALLVGYEGWARRHLARRRG